jgi:predicted dehydrogenase
MRLGLIGTGYWAEVVHAASAAQHPDVEFVGIWGRNVVKAVDLAARYSVRAYTDLEALLDEVDGLTCAVPPNVQATVAERAARHGRHLLLEKPIATSVGDARSLEAAVNATHVASIVFFTYHFWSESRAWLERVQARGPWVSGRVEFAFNIYDQGGPQATSEWRREYGALWDIGPHALSLLVPALGEITDVVAIQGARDLVHLLLQHANGRSSSMSLALTAPLAAQSRSVYVDGERGRESLSSRPLEIADSVSAHQAALDALIEQAARPSPSHPCDVHFGVRVVEVLVAAQASLASGCSVSLVSQD